MIYLEKAVEEDIKTIALLEKKYIECAWSENVIKDTLNDELSTIFVLKEKVFSNNSQTDNNSLHIYSEIRQSDGAVIGYGGYKKILDSAEIYNITVDEFHRGRGYGCMILERILSDAAENGITEIFLEVSHVNKNALCLYQKYGFTKVSERKNYYKSGNAIIMRLDMQKTSIK